MSASLLVALLAALLAGAVSGLTGFGFALISVPLLLLVYDPVTVVALIAILAVFINAIVVWDSWRFARKGLVLALLLPALVGVVAGAEVLSVVDPEYIRIGVGAVVIVSASLLALDVRLPGAGTRWGPAVAGAASGALSTSAGLAGPPIVLLLAARGLPKLDFRGTSAAYFLPLSLVIIVVLALRGLLEAGHVPLGVALLPAAFLGKLLGTAVLGRISERTFRGATLTVVIITGALGVATAARVIL